MSYTKGPWEVTKTNINSGYALAGMQLSDCAYRIEDENENCVLALVITDVPNLMKKSNADLMAAAPQLLEALEGFKKIWGSRDATSESKRAQKVRADLMDKTNAAIAKAKGQ